jgi:hypothetical protein
MKLDDDDLVALEREVTRALATGDDRPLRVLGYGEISIVLGWPRDEPRWACKRLPPVPSAATADAYEAIVVQYIDTLGRRGVDVVDTTVRRLPDDAGTTALYCVQPVLPTEALAPNVVRAGGADAEELLRAIVDRTASVVDRRVGLDAQLSNWAVPEGELRYFDITTPLLRDAEGQSELDTDLFVASLPWMLRPPVRRFVVPGILDRYHGLRTVLCDLAANLFKERLEQWIPVVLDAARTHLDVPLTEAEVQRDYRSDARTWGALQAVRRVDRQWQRRVRRRPYPFLLPPRIER